MSENDIKLIALFFFFTFLDEAKAIETATEAVETCRRLLSQKTEMKPTVALVIATEQIWKKTRGRVSRGHSNYSSTSGWKLPLSIEMGPWKEFRKSAPEEELLVVVWSQILKISDQDISAGLGLSEGTIRYRLGKGFKKLGALTPSSFQRASLGVVPR